MDHRPFTPLSTTAPDTRSSARTIALTAILLTGGGVALADNIRGISVKKLVAIPGAPPQHLMGNDHSGLAGGGAPGAIPTFPPAISRSGRDVAFTSAATDLVEGDTNGFTDVFVRDRDLDGDSVFDRHGFGATKTACISVPVQGGFQANGPSGIAGLGMSGDGRYVVFDSLATNLLGSSDFNAAADVFLHDRDADGNNVFDETSSGATSLRRISVNPAGGDSNGASFDPSISADGRFIAFTTAATNLVASDANGAITDIAVHDRDADGDGIFDEFGKTRVFLASVGAQGQADGPSREPDVTSYILEEDTWFFVAFTSAATNLVPADANGEDDVFSRAGISTLPGVVGPPDTSRQSVLGSLDAPREAVGGASHLPSVGVHFVGDDLWTSVAFASFARNLGFPTTPGMENVFIRNVSAAIVEEGMETSATTELVSRPPFGSVPANGPSSAPSFVRGGDRSLAFHSSATNLSASPDTDTFRDVYVLMRDLTFAGSHEIASSASLVLVSNTRFGTTSLGDNSFPVVGSLGLGTVPVVAFASASSNSVAGDRNDRWDVHVTHSGPGTVSICPDRGSLAGGETVCLYGGFTTPEMSPSLVDTTVEIGDVDITPISLAPGQITFLTPASTPGMVFPEVTEVHVILGQTFIRVGKSTVPFTFTSSLATDIQSGDVGAGTDIRQDVLTINGSTGGPTRTISVPAQGQITVAMSPAYGLGANVQFAMYASIGAAGAMPFANPLTRPVGGLVDEVGWTSWGTPLGGETPQPVEIWNNIQPGTPTGASFGTPTRNSTPAFWTKTYNVPSYLLPGSTVVIQGFMQDSDSLNASGYSTTNAINIEIQ